MRSVYGKKINAMQICTTAMLRFGRRFFTNVYTYVYERKITLVLTLSEVLEDYRERSTHTTRLISIIL